MDPYGEIIVLKDLLGKKCQNSILKSKLYDLGSLEYHSEYTHNVN